MYLFSRNPLSNTEYNRSDHSIANKTCDSNISIPHTDVLEKETRFQKQTCWQFAGATISFLPHITNRGDTHLCRKVTTLHQLTKGWMSKCNMPETPPPSPPLPAHTHPHPSVERTTGVSQSEMHSLKKNKKKSPKVIPQPLWLCIQFVF